jgi:hypothetical protein
MRPRFLALRSCSQSNFMTCLLHRTRLRSDHHDPHMPLTHTTPPPCRYDALQLQMCSANGVPNRPVGPAPWRPPTAPPPPPGAVVVYADAVAGSDITGNGSFAHPLRSLETAIAHVRARRKSSRESRTGDRRDNVSAARSSAARAAAVVVLRAGVYYLAAPVELGASDSNLTIVNYNDEVAVVSGGVALQGLDWRLLPPDADGVVRHHASSHVERHPDVSTSVSPPTPPQKWTLYNDTNNVFGQVHAGSDAPCCKYVATTQSVSACEAALTASSKGPFLSFTWQPLSAGSFAGECYGVVTDLWAPHTQAGYVSGRKGAAPPQPPPPPPPPLPRIAAARLTDTQLLDLTGTTGLRLNGGRAIRARFPNVENTETQPYSSRGPLDGYITARTEWVPPVQPSSPASVEVVSASDWPYVHW